jgi:formate/nitrite transporter
MDTEPQLGDPYPPVAIARKVEQIGVTKARADAPTMLVLAVLAGAFISLGASFYLVAVTGSELGFGPTRVVGGVAFSLGLILVVVAGAELFTGNNLIAMAWASRLVGTREVLRSWLFAYVGNVAGSLATVLLAASAGLGSLGGGAVQETVLSIARAKLDLSLFEAFARGVLCNALVCLAVWLATGARSVSDKILAILFPITAFVTLGLEHSIANWFLLPFAWALDPTLSISGIAGNLVAVTAGNLAGGTVLVAGVYWVAYLRPRNMR